MLELNLNHHYNPLYWQTAVLNSNSGSIELDETAKKQDKDYGKIAKAVGELQKEGIKVVAPLINSADYSFVPDIKNNQIIFSLKAIRGINEVVTHEVLSKRPFSSFDDFLNKVDPNIVKTQHIISLIKAGAFKEFDTVPQTMAQFIKTLVPMRESLNGQNFPSVIRLGLLNSPELQPYQELFELRKSAKSRVHKKLTNPKNRLLKVTNDELNKLNTRLKTDGMIQDYQGKYVIIDEKIMDKAYNEYMQKFYNETLNSPEFLLNFNKAQFLEEWVNRTKGGNEQKWAMDALTYYPETHELEHLDTEKYNISDYEQLDEDPKPIGFSKWRGVEYPQFPLHTIAGTVIDKNATKHTVTLLTTTGVVTCKFFGGTFAFYNKEIKINGKKEEDSWFRRGSLILVSGYRRGDQFVNKKIKGQEHSVSLITNINKGGEVSLQTDRTYM